MAKLVKFFSWQKFIRTCIQYIVLLWLLGYLGYMYNIQYMYSVIKIMGTSYMYIVNVCMIYLIGGRTGTEGHTDQVWSKGMSHCVPDNCYCWIYSLQVSVHALTHMYL